MFCRRVSKPIRFSYHIYHFLIACNSINVWMEYSLTFQTLPFKWLLWFTRPKSVKHIQRNQNLYPSCKKSTICKNDMCSLCLLGLQFVQTWAGSLLLSMCIPILHIWHHSLLIPYHQQLLDWEEQSIHLVFLPFYLLRIRWKKYNTFMQNSFYSCIFTENGPNYCEHAFLENQSFLFVWYKWSQMLDLYRRVKHECSDSDI